MPATRPGATSTAALRPSNPTPHPLGAALDRFPALRSVGAQPGVDPRTTVVVGVTLDSRAVQPGDLYAALPGASVHGADFAADAARSGATAVLTDPGGVARLRAAGVDLPVLLTDDPRAVLGALARWVHDDPASALLTFGVTGTNGKTTTAFLLEAGLRAAGHQTGLLGTVLTRIGDDVVPSVRTTPEAPDLQALLALMRERGTTAVALEISSHALVLGRVDGLVVDVAGFTNLSQDHLDFHPDMAAYEAAKASLFTVARARRGVVNAGDAAGARIAAGAGIPTTTYGAAGTWRADDVELRPDGSSFRLVGPGVELPAGVALPGDFNVANALGALVMLIEAGIDAEDAVRGVEECPGVPGRMERVEAGQPFLALVDYAHTPVAVDRLVAAVRAVTTGRVILLLGCGGDRDRAKRPLMGAAAARADLAILTSDNPRSEDPEVILAEMAAGAPAAEQIADRREAITRAVELARPGDAVVVAGKGHESGQEAGGVVVPFDDRVVLADALRAMGGTA